MNAWVIDFIRALNERPAIIKIMLKFLFGRYAYREFIGMIDDQERKGASLLDRNIGYELEKMEYHNDKMPLVWWKNG